MDEMKRITSQEMKEIMDDRFPIDNVIDYHGLELHVKRVIPVAVMKTIVESVTSSCFNSETGEYMPEFKEFAINLCIVQAFTNIELPEDRDEQYRLLFSTDLMAHIIPAIDSDVLDNMTRAIYERCNVINDANRVAFEHELMTVMQSVTQIADGIDGLFSGLSQSDIQNLVHAIGANGIDEEKLVKAVVSEQNRLRGEEDGNVTPFPFAGTVKQEE